jgi:activator of HSP90 ATPase
MSLWNKNNWHWEEQNLEKQGIPLITSLFESMTVQNLVKLANIKVSGFCKNSVRKGKRLLCFEFNVAGDFSDFSEPTSSKGKFSLPEFTNDDLDELVTVRILSFQGDEKVKETFRKQGPAEIQKILNQFKDQLTRISDDEISADLERRQAEKLKMEQAEQEKGAEKEKILQEVKAKETHEVRPEASVWNVNAYHWETKKLFPKAAEFLEKEFASLGLTDTTITGDAEVSIRKGKKIVVYEISIASSEFEVKDFAQDDEIPKIQAKTAMAKEKTAAIQDVLKRLTPFLMEI